jgi:hypothetical protein
MQRLRWTASILVVLLAVGVLGFLLRRDRVNAAREETPESGPVSAAPAAREEAAKSSPASAPQPAKEEAPKSSPVSAPQADATGTKSAGPGTDNPRLAEGPSTAATRPDPASLQTIGTLIAAHYFQTYLNIGFVADGKRKGSYSNEDAQKVLRSVLSVVDSVDQQLEILGKRILDKEDRESLEQMRAVSALLRQQSTELQAYWDSGKDQHAARYETLRKSSYAAISKLIGIGS